MVVTNAIYSWISNLYSSFQLLPWHTVLAIFSRESQPSRSMTRVEGSSTPVVSVVGTASYYPPNRMGPGHLEKIISTFHDLDPALERTLKINTKSRISNRHFAVPPNDPFWSDQTLPSISECDALFKKYGFPVAEEAARKAIADWGGSSTDITHVIAVTCTNTANPGMDFMLCEKLGLHKNVERTLLHGIGCAGASSWGCSPGRPGKALVVACELISIFCRAEIAAIVKDQEVNIGATLFGDGAGALVLSNGVGVGASEKAPVWNILNARSTVLKDSANCLEFNVHPHDVPKHVYLSLASGFKDLIATTPSLDPSWTKLKASGCDWALHPGGYGILLLAQQALGITEDHLRKSYDVYQNRGNTSSATVLSVINELAHEENTAEARRDKVVVGSFGPGIAMEMALMVRVTGNA
ncbi:hypothetical protein N7490_005646 [Penicillium lividum]|nr:hypothetical protein N7490_005646 [Penicillium lividum]